jgi:hypothetical protein
MSKDSEARVEVVRGIVAGDIAESLRRVLKLFDELEELLKKEEDRHAVLLDEILGSFRL